MQCGQHVKDKKFQREEQVFVGVCSLALQILRYKCMENIMNVPFSHIDSQDNLSKPQGIPRGRLGVGLHRGRARGISRISTTSASSSLKRGSGSSLSSRGKSPSIDEERSVK